MSVHANPDQFLERSSLSEVSSLERRAEIVAAYLRTGEISQGEQLELGHNRWHACNQTEQSLRNALAAVVDELSGCLKQNPVDVGIVDHV